MNASLRGVMFVKADRINQRIRQVSELFNGDIEHDKFLDFIKTIEIIVNDELTEKGIERKWRA